MSFSKKEGVMWGGAVIIALVVLVAWYGWVGDWMSSAPEGSAPVGSEAPSGLDSGGGDD